MSLPLLLAATDPAALAEHSRLIWASLAGIALLLLLVIRFKMHAFLALMLVSFAVGVMTGMKPADIVASVQKGMGSTLGFVAVVVGLGSIFGKVLEVSGGAERLAKGMLAGVGDARAPWVLGLVGFLISIPIFLDVGLIIVMPILYGLTVRSGRPLLYFGIPLLAGLAVSHSMIPPTPGPLAVANLIKADVGWMIFFGVVAGLPAMLVAGPLFGRWISQRVKVGVPAFMNYEEPKEGEGPELPGFGLVLSLLLTPLVLILAGSTIDYTAAKGTWVAMTMAFLGHPFVALLIATLLTCYFLGRHCGFSREKLTEVANKSLEPAGIIILVTGAGGVFKQVLIDSGVGQMLGATLGDSTLSPVLLAFIIATLVRVAQGSATVAMVTTGGIMAPINVAVGWTLAEGAVGAVVPHATQLLALQGIAIACGATVLSHVNDSGFWLVNRFFGLTVNETLMSWTVMETIVGLVAFSIVFSISLFL